MRASLRLVRVTVIALLPFAGTLAASETMQAETQTDSGDRWPTPVFHFAQDPSRYVKLTAALQLWLRRTDLNPGSAVSGRPAAEATDLSVRRLRFGSWLVPSEKTAIRLNFGFNNLNRLTKGNVDLDLLDAYGEFQATNEFHIGAGKSGWNGLSRYASPNPMTALTYDLPMIAIPTVNVTDNLLRNLGIFIKGQINRLDYRVTAYQPTSVEESTTGTPVFEEDIAEFRDEDSGNSTGFSGYLKWQFFEHESNASAFSPGTYLGEKKVMALGFGYEFDSNRTAHLKNGELIINDLKLRAVDFFLDLPLNQANKNALTIYAAYYDYDYGPNLVRNIGVNNIATVSDPDLLSFNGPGNAYPLLGTGTSLYLEAGYLTRHLRLGRLQPYLSIQRSRFDRLDEPMLAWSLGAHWLLKGHQSKFSVNLASRPLYFEEGNSITVKQRKLEFVIQYQITI